jgi:quinol monooxygenase YgiN
MAWQHRQAMDHVLIIHDVVDYPAWKRVFDDAAGLRYEAGERSYQVLRDHTTPNRVVHFSTWPSVEAARVFFESPRLVQIRRDAGVHAPEFIYLHEAASGVLGGSEDVRSTDTDRPPSQHDQP